MIGHQSSPDSVQFSLGARYPTAESIHQKALEISHLEGFKSSTSPHCFPKSNPHPSFPDDTKLIQRGRVYCNHKDSSSKKIRSCKTTCTWSISYTFDRQSLDYYITKLCLDHNHSIDDPNIKAGMLKHIHLESQLLPTEMSELFSLSKYSMPFYKVF